jgi:hypothetical protein
MVSQPVSVYPPVVSGSTLDRLNPESPQSENYDQSSLQKTIVQTEYVHPNKGIRLYLYANPEKYSGLQIAWQGCIEAGESVSPDREPLLIRTLLGYFGQDYAGSIDLK